MMPVLAGALKSKTVWFHLLSLAAIILGGDEIKHVIAPERLIELQALIGMGLRLLTSQSLGEKGA